MSLDARVAVRLGALDLDVSLHVARGEVVAVLGPNGAGKSTLLRVLAGLLPLARGRLQLDGHVLEDVEQGIRQPTEQRGVGLVFQDYLLFPHLSVRENVAFGLRARGMGRSAAAAKADEWLARVHLAGAATARPKALSGGQAQRVALARALATEPALLLLDEPLAALDVEARLSIRRELRTHLDAFRGPCLLVTHDPLEAITLADRLVILEAGRVTQSGSTREVTQRPRSPWVARLVGLNLLRGVADGYRIKLETGGVLVSAAAGEGATYAVIHPCAVALHRNRPEGSPRNVWRAGIRSMEALGEHVRVLVGDEIPIVAEVTPAGAAELDLAAGNDIWVSVKATEVDVYPV